MIAVTRELFGDDGLDHWEAACFELPGVTGYGETEDEAVENLEKEIARLLATVTIH